MRSFLIPCLALSIGVATPVLAAVDNSESAEYVQEAKEYLKKGNLEAAIIQYKNAARVAPKNPDIRYELGKAYLKKADGLSAEKEFLRSIELGKPAGEVALDLSQAYLILRKYEEVLELVDPETAEGDDKAQAYLFLGMAHQGLQQQDKALEYLQKGAELKTNDDNIIVGIAQIYNFKQEFEQSEEMVDKALALNPKNARALMLKGELVHRREGPAKSLDYFANALQYEPNNINAMIKKAGVLFDLKRDEEALEVLESVFKLIPRHPTANYLAAVIYARKNDTDKATEYLDRGGVPLDKFEPALMLRGVLNYSQQNYAQSIYYLSRLVDLNPGHTVGRRLLGASLIRQGDPEQAVKVLTPMAEAGTAGSVVYALLGSAHLKLGDYEKGTEYFEKAVEARPEESRLRTQLALSRLAAGDSRSAEEQLTAILENDPEASQAAVFLTLISLRQGEYAKGLIDAERTIKQMPSNPIGYNLKGTALVGLNRIDEAREFFAKALEINPDYNTARINLAKLDVNEGKIDKAEKIYRDILAKDKAYLAAWLGLSDIAARQNDRQKQEEYLLQAVSAAPENISVRVQLSELYLTERRLDKAKAVANQMIQDFPENGAGYEAAGKLDRLMGNKVSAIANFQKLLTIIGKNEKGYLLLGRAQMENEDFAGARNTYKEALEFAGDKKTVLTELVRLEMIEKSYSSAHRYVKQIRELDPDGFSASVLDGRVYLAEGKPEEALKHYLEGQKKGAEGGGIVISIAQAYKDMNDLDSSHATMVEYLNTHPNDLVVRRNLANSYLMAGDSDKATEQYEDLLARNDNNVVNLNNLAWLYSQNGEMDKARALGKQAYDAAPENASITDTYAWILVSSGKHEEGLELLQKAISKTPNNMEIRYHLAVALHKSGRDAAARQELEQAVTSGVSFTGLEEAKALLQQLRK